MAASDTVKKLYGIGPWSPTRSPTEPSSGIQMVRIWSPRGTGWSSSIWWTSKVWWKDFEETLLDCLMLRCVITYCCVLSSTLARSIIQRTLTLGGSVTVQLTSCLTGYYMTKRVNMLLIKHNQSSWIYRKFLKNVIDLGTLSVAKSI